MDIFEWDEQTPVTANNMNEMQNILNNNISENVLDKYSTNETIIGVWIDGKPIYRKVIKITNPALSAITDYNHQIGNVDMLRPVEAFVLRNIDNTIRTINVSYSTSTVFVQGSKTNISYRIPTDLWNWIYQSSDLTLYVIVEYTKITD